MCSGRTTTGTHGDCTCSLALRSLVRPARSTLPLRTRRLSTFSQSSNSRLLPSSSSGLGSFSGFSGLPVRHDPLSSGACSCWQLLLLFLRSDSDLAHRPSPPCGPLRPIRVWVSSICWIRSRSRCVCSPVREQCCLTGRWSRRPGPEVFRAQRLAAGRSGRRRSPAHSGALFARPELRA